MSENLYHWTSVVRDYELDGQGIVNNATYVNYFEQCRNDYARDLGIDFVEFAKAGFTFVVAGIEVQYRLPLGAQDGFYVTAAISGYDEKRIHFNQEIRHTATDNLVAKASVHIACVDNESKRACMPDMLTAILAKFQPALITS